MIVNACNICGPSTLCVSVDTFNAVLSPTGLTCGEVQQSGYDGNETLGPAGFCPSSTGVVNAAVSAICGCGDDGIGVGGGVIP